MIQRIRFPIEFQIETDEEIPKNELIELLLKRVLEMPLNLPNNVKLLMASTLEERYQYSGVFLNDEE